MKTEKYQSYLASMTDKRNLWRVVSLVLLISNFLLVVKLVGIEVKEKTIIVPADLSKSFWVHGDNVSPSYVEEMANMFAMWLKNFHPDNVESQFARVLTHADPRVYSELKDWLESEVERVKKLKITSSFYPMSIHINGKVVDIKARVVGMIGERVVNDDIKVLRLQLKYHGGRMIVSGFQDGSISGNKFVGDKSPVGSLSEYLEKRDTGY